MHLVFSLNFVHIFPRRKNAATGHKPTRVSLKHCPVSHHLSVNSVTATDCVSR